MAYFTAAEEARYRALGYDIIPGPGGPTLVPPVGNEAEFGMVGPEYPYAGNEAEFGVVGPEYPINPEGGVGTRPYGPPVPLRPPIPATGANAYVPSGVTIGPWEGPYNELEGGTNMASDAALRERMGAGAPEYMYRQSQGIPQQGYLDPWQKYLMNRYGQVSGMGRLEQAISGVTELGYTPRSPYEDVYTQQIPEGGRYEEAKRLWGYLSQMTASQREGAGIGQEDYSGLLGMALRPTLGRYGSGIAAGRVPGFQQEYERKSLEQAGAPAPSFYDYLRTKYNL